MKKGPEEQAGLDDERRTNQGWRWRAYKTREGLNHPPHSLKSELARIWVIRLIKSLVTRLPAHSLASHSALAPSIAPPSPCPASRAWAIPGPACPLSPPASCGRRSRRLTRSSSSPGPGARPGAPPPPPLAAGRERQRHSRPAP